MEPLGGFLSTVGALYSTQPDFLQFLLGFDDAAMLLQVRSRLGGRVLRGVCAYAGLSSRDMPPTLAVHLSHRLGWQVL